MKKTPHRNSKILKKNLKCKCNISYFFSSSHLFLLKNKTKNRSSSSSSRQEAALARRAQPRTPCPISPPASLATARGSPRSVPVCVCDAQRWFRCRGPCQSSRCRGLPVGHRHWDGCVTGQAGTAQRQRAGVGGAGSSSPPFGNRRNAITPA